MIKSSIIGLLMFGMLTAFVVIVPSQPSVLAYVGGTGSAFIIVVHFFISARSKKKLKGKGALWVPMFSLSLLFLLLPLFFAAILHMWGVLSFFTWMLVISLCVVFYINFLCIPLAIYQKRRENKQADDLSHFPSISILVPAYNEEKVVRRAIETTLEANYPGNKELVIIDDGSTDSTYQIAMEYADRGVKVIHRPNGGKPVAINHGLRFSQGDIIIIVDADSMVGKNTLVELVQPLQDPEIARQLMMIVNTLSSGTTGDAESGDMTASSKQAKTNIKHIEQARADVTYNGKKALMTLDWEKPSRFYIHVRGMGINKVIDEVYDPRAALLAWSKAMKKFDGKLVARTPKQRELIQRRRHEILTDDEPTSLLSQRDTDRYTELESRVGEARLHEVERKIALFHLDRIWAEHLAQVADIRESIHLVSVGGNAPINEFHKIVNAAFLELDHKIEESALQTFAGLKLKGDDLDLDVVGS